MRNIFSKVALAMCVGSMLSMTAHAGDVVVIVNKGNANAVDKTFVVKAYTGEARSWPDGGQVAALDQGEDNAVRTQFDTTLLGKSSANMKALWAQNVFSGKGLPPKVIDGDAEVKKAVSADKNAIGYIHAEALDDSVKSVAK